VNSNSGRYWICIDSRLRVHRKQKLNRAPSLGQTIDGVWIALGKKTWQKCRVGAVVSEKVVPEESMRLVRAMRSREGNLPS
jgi:hypothetical protein